MQIVSYNINGIRAALKKGLAGWLKESSPDICCFQEIKAQAAQIEQHLFQYLGYKQYWFPAEKKGYSGVGILSKHEPENLVEGMGLPKYDTEGRVLRVDFPGFTLINAYFPSGSSGDARQAFKMRFLSDFREYIDALKKEKPNLMICGDFNICHTGIDINNPKRHHKTSGFLPEEREWMTNFFESGFVDTFRMFDTRPENYSWWSYRANARAKNLGWRIDYHVASLPLKEKIRQAAIWPEAYHSDHCPVMVELGE